MTYIIINLYFQEKKARSIDERKEAPSESNPAKTFISILSPK